MTFKRWLPTFLAFAIGGEIAIETVGSLDGPLTAAAGGLLVGAVVGGAQWLALRPGGMSRRWAVYTAAAMAAGAALASVLTSAGTAIPDVMLTGLVAGAAVGAAQSTLLPRGPRVAAIWTSVTAGAWSLGWLVTSQVIVDIERGYHTFGASGAAVVTVLTGLTLRRLLAGAAPAGSLGPVPVAASA